MTGDELSKAYDDAANQYLFSRTNDTTLSGFHNREIEQPTMFRLVPENLTDTVLLDIGCGPGIHMKKYVERGAIATGIDPSKEMIKLANDYCPEGIFKVGTVYNLGFEDSSFDIVTASFVVDHLEELEKAVQEISRVLKPKGLFIFSAPHPIRYMFRNSEKDIFVPSNSYFDKQKYCHNIAKSSGEFPSYPRLIQDYFKILSKANFTLEDFVENEPKESWREKYPDLDENNFRIPSTCFFKWKKK
ncbi:class I SAM-dependent methyltransferase [Candidatus Woesearchaeota archaeon]|nr:class I SAM-dependent methyltransferase [Candidatus Woesearchaeota archaeon]